VGLGPEIFLRDTDAAERVRTTRIKTLLSQLESKRASGKMPTTSPHSDRGNRIRFSALDLLPADYVSAIGN